MNCPRCNSLAFYQDFENGEWVISCSICGFHSSQYIESHHGELPIFRSSSNTPLGVVVTIKGNIPYYTKEQKENLLKDSKSRGYTFFNGTNWVYTKKEVLSPMPVSDLEFEHQE